MIYSTARSEQEGDFIRTMRSLLIPCILLVALPTFAQTTTPKINGISEPPELKGEPKKATKPSETDSELFEIIGHLKNEDEIKSTLPKLDEFIEKHPDYSDALFLRATCKACILNSRDFTSIQNDVAAAMSHSGQVYNNTDYCSRGHETAKPGNLSEIVLPAHLGL